MSELTRTAALLAAALGLAACGEGTNPLNNPDPGGGGGGGGGGQTSGVPAALARNMSAMSYNAQTGQLVITLQGLDADGVTARFDRAPQLDVPGYVAFTTQDDPLDRMFTALAATSFDGAVTAGVAADGGQFARYFPGGYYVANEPYRPPAEAGLATFAGHYAAVTNVEAPGSNLRPVPPGTDPSLLPAESARIDGMIFLNIQFGENQLNGAIFDRQYTDYGTPLPDLALLPAPITREGSFFGTVERDLTAIGSYGGTLAGAGGTSIGGLVVTKDFDPNDGNSLEEENGVFVLTRCGLAGDDDAACSVAEALGD